MSSEGAPGCACAAAIIVVPAGVAVAPPAPPTIVLGVPDGADGAVPAGGETGFPASEPATARIWLGTSLDTLSASEGYLDSLQLPTTSHLTSHPLCDEARSLDNAIDPHPHPPGLLQRLPVPTAETRRLGLFLLRLMLSSQARHAPILVYAALVLLGAPRHPLGIWAAS
eukprot:CAMPEP_0181390582 /NCGR_PEP_ID=MMETSP1106-20121128/25565_1 /TAXON_ID=81844 /ORGANISM="Mantoniella antarctica, Strain SL-175" /LENGTH=168 /DNA_ID=CAMNT_0023511509 /DNA_START=566 /DNA_END=1068 /DNA_ORIENTATION=+